MRSVVFAYHDVGYVCVRELLQTGDEIAAVVTHPDAPGEAIWFRSVSALAAAHGIPVFAPDRVNSREWVARLRGWQPDFIFSFYYRSVLAPEILTIPARGALNLHGSLLPKYRGRCPVNWVLIHDEHETGVTLHYMEAKPDRGDVVAQRRVPITDADTACTLFHKITAAAATVLRDTYPLLRAGTAPRLPQAHAAASYFGGRGPDDGRIDWSSSARAVFNLVRAVTHPYPGAFTDWRQRRLYIWEARPAPPRPDGAAPPGTITAVHPQLEVQTGTGVLQLVRVQLAGEAECSGVTWAQSHSIDTGERLT